MNKQKLVNLHHSSLTMKVAKGGLWISSIRISYQLLSFIRTLIIARFLSPADFGLMGVALLSISLLYTLSETGIAAALVQKKDDISEYLDTAWLIGIVRGFIIFSALFCTADFFAKFFNNPQVAPILKVIAFSPLILSFNSPKTAYFQKDFQFNKQFICEFSATLVDVAISIIIALKFRNVWSLVIGYVAGNVTRLVVSYIVLPYVPRFRFVITQAKELFHFGKWIFGNSILSYFNNYGCDVIIGRILGLVNLGFYQMAYRISNIPASETSYMLSRLTFPAYSKIQGDLPRVRNAYLKVLKVVTFFSFPIAGFIFVLGNDFTRLYLGQKWIPIIAIMQILSIGGFIRSIGATFGPVFLGLGKPKILTKFMLLQLILLVFFIYQFSTKWGLTGIAFAVVLTMFITNLMILILVMRTLSLDPKNFLKVLFSSFINMILATSVVSIIKIYMPLSNVLKLFIVSIVGLIIYFILTYLFNKDLKKHFEFMILGMR
jgi:O-antigen/teichoic acid export membrane protein